MKITEVKSLIARTTIKNWVIVKVTTDEGICGLGDATVGNKALTCAACVQDMARLLIGQDPRRIQQHWQTLRMNAMAAGNVVDTCISGIDMALWDILGKSLGVPVYQLLGGPVRDRIQVYASGVSQGARAAGEKWRTKHGFHDVVGQRACSIVQPDPHCGGIFELRLIAAMAEARYMAVIPHQAASPINAAAALQFAACTPNVLCVEHFEQA